MVYDVVYRRREGVGVAVIRRDGEDLLMWIPQQNFAGKDGDPILRKDCPEVWDIVAELNSDSSYED